MSEKTYKVKQNGLTVLEITIKQPEDTVYTNIQWDSKTGLVTANVNGDSKRVPIHYTGTSYGVLQPGPFEAENVYKMDYNYWYY